MRIPVLEQSEESYSDILTLSNEQAESLQRTIILIIFIIKSHYSQKNNKSIQLFFVQITSNYIKVIPIKFCNF